MKAHYLDDRVLLSENGKVKYGFKIKGGKYGDLGKVMREESGRRHGDASGKSFLRVQNEYDGANYNE